MKMSASHAVNNPITNKTISKEEQNSIKQRGFCSRWSLSQLYPEIPARSCRYKTASFPASGSTQPKKEDETKIRGSEVTWLKTHWAQSYQRRGGKRSDIVQRAFKWGGFNCWSSFAAFQFNNNNKAISCLFTDRMPTSVKCQFHLKNWVSLIGS